MLLGLCYYFLFKSGVAEPPNKWSDKVLQDVSEAIKSKIKKIGLEIVLF